MHIFYTFVYSFIEKTNIFVLDLSLHIAEDTHKNSLKLIRDHGELSGAQIARLTGLQPSTVVYILRRLNEDGFIEYSRTGESTKKGGKRPVLWKINGSFGYILGLEVLVDKIRYVLTDFSGEITARNEIAYDNYLKKESLSEAIIANIKDIQHHLSLSRKRVLGIGIAITGLIDRTGDKVRYSSNLQLFDMPLKQMIEEQIDIPVYLVNDAKAGALSIKWYSQSVDDLPSNIVYITYNQISDTLGTGVILNDILHQGASGTAGEMFDPLPDLVQVGRDAIKQLGYEGPLKKSLDSGKSILLSQIFDYTRENDPVAKKMVESIIEFLADEILVINGFIDPELIVLGGDIALGEDLILPSLIPVFKKKNKEFLKIDDNIPRIMFSEYGNYSVAIGANAFIIRKILG
jgi:predicted NBD/HSP70 family sugar kinase